MSHRRVLSTSHRIILKLCNKSCFIILNSKFVILVISSVNPFSPTLSLIVAKMSLSKRSGPYWSNPPFFIF